MQLYIKYLLLIYYSDTFLFTCCIEGYVKFFQFVFLAISLYSVECVF